MEAPNSMVVPENLYQLLEGIPKGSWVALSEDQTRVVAHDPDLANVFRTADAAGERDPVITRVPETETFFF